MGKKLTLKGPISAATRLALVAGLVMPPLLFLLDGGRSAFAFNLFGSDKVYKLKNCTQCTQTTDMMWGLGTPNRKVEAGDKKCSTFGTNVTAKLNTDYKAKVFVLVTESGANVKVEDFVVGARCSFESTSTMYCVKEEQTKDDSSSSSDNFLKITSDLTFGKSQSARIARGRFSTRSSAWTRDIARFGLRTIMSENSVVSTLECDL